MNNNSINFSDWTVKKLKEEYTGYKELIEVAGGSSYSDLMNYEGIKFELEDRGFYNYLQDKELQ